MPSLVRRSSRPDSARNCLAVRFKGEWGKGKFSQNASSNDYLNKPLRIAAHSSTMEIFIPKGLQAISPGSC